MATIGTAYVQIVPSAKGIKGSITNALGGEADHAGDEAGKGIAGKIKGAIAAAGVGTAIGSVIKNAVDTGGQLEQAIGGIETLFGDASDKMISYADMAYKTAGVSAVEYMNQTSSFAAALKQNLSDSAAADAANQAVIDMSDNANKMGTSMESIQNAYQGFSKANYTMLDNLKLGYGGTKEEMQRLLTDAEKITGQKYNMDNLGDVFSAIHVIQDELGITGTTSKEAATTLEGSFSAMKSSATNLLGSMALGQDIKPSLMALVETTGTYLFGNLLPMIGRVVAQIPNVAGALLQTYGPVLMDKLLTGVNVGLPKLAEAAPKIVNKITTGLTTHLPKIMQKGGEFIGKLAAGIVNNLPKIAVSLAKILASVIKALAQLPGIALNGAKTMVSTFISNFDLAQKLAQKFEQVRSAVKAKMESVKSTLSSIWERIKGIFANAVTLKIKVPHISVSGGKAPWGIGGLGTKPSFSVSWNKEGGIFNRASIIGYGVGEAGEEAILPLDRFWKKMDAIGTNQNTVGMMQMLNDIHDAIKAGQIIKLDSGAIVGATADRMDYMLGKYAYNGRG